MKNTNMKYKIKFHVLVHMNFSNVYPGTCQFSNIVDENMKYTIGGVNVQLQNLRKSAMWHMTKHATSLISSSFERSPRSEDQQFEESLGRVLVGLQKT